MERDTCVAVRQSLFLTDNVGRHLDRYSGV
jgi:hypothetical protein